MDGGGLRGRGDAQGGDSVQLSMASKVQYRGFMTSVESINPLRVYRPSGSAPDSSVL